MIQRTLSLRRLVLITIVGTSFASGAFASGGGGGGPGGSFARSRTDATYELGKTIFRGRSAKARGLQVCVLDQNSESQNAIAITRETLKPFRRGSSGALKPSLVECGSEPRPVVQQLGQSDMNALVHYLNKRYRLKLRG